MGRRAPANTTNSTTARRRNSTCGSTRPGRIRTWLDPYRRHAYHHNRDLLCAFREMDGQLPAALVVQQVSRAALRHACASGAWRVEPALVAAVDAAVAAYEAVRAPFYTPNPVQSLGWIDEESFITCAKDGIPGIRAGDQCPLKSWIEETTWEDSKTNLAGNVESLELSGRELVVEVTAPDGSLHHFHVRRDDATGELDAKSVAGAGTPHRSAAGAPLPYPVLPRPLRDSDPEGHRPNQPRNLSGQPCRLAQLEAHINRAA